MENKLSPAEKYFDIFIEGEVVDLCVPNDEQWVLEQWYRWFNDQETTRYLEQGVFPNSLKKQKEYFESTIHSKDRIVLLIKPKNYDYFVGVTSLSYIDLAQRQCHFSMVIGKKDNSPDSMFYAMETKCRMTEHAFENVGVERINSGQVIDLIKWQRWQILFGYQIEGIMEKHFRKGNKTYDVMISSCLLEDYTKIKEIRNGFFWPGKSKLFELLKMLPGESSIDKLQKWLSEEREYVWKTIKFDIP